MIVYIIGLISGIIGGMGIGGGAVLIPAFILFINIDQHIIQSINLLYFIPTAVIALIIHVRNKLISFKLAGTIIIFGIIGSIIGSNLAVSMQSPILRKSFGIFLFMIGIYEMFGDTIKNKLIKSSG